MIGGDVALATHPFGVGQTVTMDVSALGRSHLEIQYLRGTSSRPTRRSAGQLRRALVDSQRQPDRHQHGHLLALWRFAGIGFAIPISLARKRHGTDHPDRQRDSWLDWRRGAGKSLSTTILWSARYQRRPDCRSSCAAARRMPEDQNLATFCLPSPAGRSRIRRACST